MLVVDFETEGIVGNPTVHPPKPVGVAFKRPGYKSRYFAWGHPTKNNSTKEAARAVLAEAVAAREQLLFYHAKFDLAVMWKWFEVLPEQGTVQDAMFLVYLQDPYAASFALKESAQRLLGMEHPEQDKLREWILAHIRCAPSQTGQYISKAPGDLVGEYAKGDVDRTLALYTHLVEAAPSKPYQREIQLLPIIMEGERRGIRCNVELLGSHTEKYETTLIHVDQKLHKLLKSDCNLDSGEELANAMDKAGMVDQWVLTPTGRRSTARDNLERAIAVKHHDFLRLLQYRGALSHCLSNFCRPWLNLASEHNGRLHPEWNQVRQSAGGKDSKGTRTGRLSSNNPNFQNPPNEYELAIPQGFPDLPIMRKYMLPEKGHVWIKRDYSQQELRILAHYSEGRLFERYQEDPTVDAHVEASAIIHENSGLSLPRKYVKITGFSMIYGSGVPSLAGQLGVPISDAYNIKNAYLEAFPEVKDLMDNCRERGRSGLYITTWGGRNYYVEPPKIIKGRMVNFDYKLLNYLIQGSAADCTKEALIRWNNNPGDGLFLATVHDEINASAPKETWKADMVKLRKAMESIEFDVKMLSDGYYGDSWATLKPLRRV